MSRSSNSQSVHDRYVKSVANRYQNNGYDVNADIAGWSKPDVINGYRPDVQAKKGSQTTIIEVETPDSVNSSRDLAQQKAFREWALKSEYRHFKRIVTD